MSREFVNDKWTCPICGGKIDVRIPVAGGMGSHWRCSNECCEVDGADLKLTRLKKEEIKIDINPRKINKKALKEEDAKDDDVILYDLRKDNYPSKRGDTFRSLQVFECWVCKAVTNEIIMGGSMGYGVRAVCPNGSKCWHHELEDKVKLLAKPHPKSYKDELTKDIENDRNRYQNRIKNDILGNPDLSLKEEVTNVRSWDSKSKCTHGW